MLSDAEQVNRDYSFADSSMSSAAAGVAGRLVMYSQKLVNSFGYVPSTGPGAFYFKLLFCLGIDWPAPMGHWSPLVHVRHLLPRTNKQARAWIKTPTYLWLSPSFPQKKLLHLATQLPRHATTLLWGYQARDRFQQRQTCFSNARRVKPTQHPRRFQSLNQLRCWNRDSRWQRNIPNRSPQSWDWIEAEREKRRCLG